MDGRALLIIDVQNAILDGFPGDRGDAARTALDRMVGRVAALLSRARQAGLRVFHVQHDGTPDHRLAVGTPGWAIRAELAPEPGETVIRKTACDAFYGTGLERELRTAGVAHLLVAGCMTQYCVDTTVRRAVSLGFDVTLAADGHTTADAGMLGFEQIVAHHNALLDGFDAGANVVTLRPCAVLPG